MLKYASGPTALLASSLDGVKDFKATDDNTVVVTYKRPVAPVLANLEQFFILPEHIWSQYTGNNGKDLKAFFPEKHLPVVAGGAYSVTKYEPKGVDRASSRIPASTARSPTRPRSRCPSTRTRRR